MGPRFRRRKLLPNTTYSSLHRSSTSRRHRPVAAVRAVGSENAHDSFETLPYHRSMTSTIEPPRVTLADIAAEAQVRSEERRVGEECVSTCRSRGSPYH